MSETECQPCDTYTLRSPKDSSLHFSEGLETTKGITKNQIQVDPERAVYSSSSGAGVALVCFLILFVVLVITIYTMKPSFALKRGTNKVDNGKAVLTAFIAALLVVILVWAIASIGSRSRK